VPSDASLDFEESSMNVASESSFTLAERAARLHAYVAPKFPQFPIQSAEQLVTELRPYWCDPIKALAKRVRAGLASRGVVIGHQVSLHVTARLQGFDHLFQVPKGPDRLQTVLFDAELAPVNSPDWRACAQILVDACERWLAAHPHSRLVRLDVSPNLLTMHGVQPNEAGESGVEMPIAAVGPLEGGMWLEGAASALETLRRRVEESQPQRATLGGLALVRFCSTRDKEALPYCPWPRTQAADAPYSELVLSRQDHDLEPGYEVVRGDEAACWLQLLEALGTFPPSSVQLADDGAWQCGTERYVWEVVTLRPHDIVPGLSHSLLPLEESRHLLRRFQAAARGGHLRPVNDLLRRRWGGIDQPPSHCRLDAHRVLHALKARGETWESFSALIGAEPLMPTQPIDMGMFLDLAEHLQHKDPASLLLRPTRSELSPVTCDQLVRALMPRVDHVRYRIPQGLEQEQRQALDEAVQDFATSLALRNGALGIRSSLPDVVFAGDGEELRLALESIGLVMFVGLMPHLTPVPDNIRAEYPLLRPYALGTALFVDIDKAA
jgi:hypothetical protein